MLFKFNPKNVGNSPQWGLSYLNNCERLVSPMSRMTFALTVGRERRRRPPPLPENMQLVTPRGWYLGGGQRRIGTLFCASRGPFTPLAQYH
jgi:hypothetical protein